MGLSKDNQKDFYLDNLNAVLCADRDKDYYFKTDSEGNIIYPNDSNKLEEIRTILLTKPTPNVGIIPVGDSYYNYITNEELAADGKVIINHNLYNRNSFVELAIKQEKSGKNTTTGLTNAVFTYDNMDKYVENVAGRDRQGACLYMDANELKHINDKYGHDAGNIYLNKIGQILKNSLRDDDILGHIGGDEFIIILKDVSPVQAELKTKEIMEKMKAARVILSNVKVSSVSVSMGTYHFSTKYFKTIEDVTTEELSQGIKSVADDQQRISKECYRKTGEIIYCFTSGLEILKQKIQQIREDRANNNEEIKETKFVR